MTPASPVAFPTSLRCRVCGGQIVYSGRGRRPEYDSPECRRKGRTEYERVRARLTRPVDATLAERLDALVARRAAEAGIEGTLADLVARRRARVAAAPYVEVWKAEDDWLPTQADLEAEHPLSAGSYDGTDAEDLDPATRGTRKAQGWKAHFVDDGEHGDRWSREVRRTRGADPAALWLAENAPEALEDFGPDLDEGRSR